MIRECLVGELIMKLLKALVLFTVLFIFVGCLQNFKDNELVATNRTDAVMTLHVNGTSYRLDTNQTVTVNLPPKKYEYGTVWSIPGGNQYPQQVENLINSAGAGAEVNFTSSATDLSGEMDFISKGTRISLDYIAHWDTKVTPGKPAAGDTPAEPPVIDITYKISGISTSGWTD